MVAVIFEDVVPVTVFLKNFVQIGRYFLAGFFRVSGFVVFLENLIKRRVAAGTLYHTGPEII